MQLKIKMIPVFSAIYVLIDRADCSLFSLFIVLSFLLQSAVEPFIKVVEYPATKGTTPPTMRSDGP